MGLHDGHRARLRGRSLEHGLDGLQDHEVLELLLFWSIPRRDTAPIAHALLDRFGSLSAVFSASAADLEEVDGVGPGTSALIRLVPQICRRTALEGSGPVLATTEQAGTYLVHCFEGEVRETAYQLCLDQRGKILSRRRIGEGGLSFVALDIRSLVREALDRSASSVILAHDHPSGELGPSWEDIDVTRQVRDALAMVGIVLRDHFIVADGAWVSMREGGYL